MKRTFLSAFLATATAGLKLAAQPATWKKLADDFQAQTLQTRDNFPLITSPANRSSRLAMD